MPGSVPPSFSHADPIACGLEGAYGYGRWSVALAFRHAPIRVAVAEVADLTAAVELIAESGVRQAAVGKSLMHDARVAALPGVVVKRGTTADAVVRLHRLIGAGALAHGSPLLEAQLHECLIDSAGRDRRGDAIKATLWAGELAAEAVEPARIF